MLMFFVVFGIMALLAFLYGGVFLGEHNTLLAVLLAIPASLIVTVVAKFVLGKLGSPGGALFGGRDPMWDIREQYAADMSQAKHGIENKNYDNAINAINRALKQDPNWPEALFLKARIVWEGFENAHSAKNYLKQAIKLTSKDDSLNEEAMELYNELMAIEKTQKNLSAKK